jgi:phosphoribosylformylglycinamidine cyclo-ligase
VAKGATYKDSGVDIQAGYKFVNLIKPYAQSTSRSEVMTDIGSFGGFFRLGSYKDPVLVSGTDGVGTKLKLAFIMDKHDTIGIDVVAYCVNDIICHGVEPIFFLDYLACGKLDPEKMALVVKGVADGCVDAGCALIGGETAEMPGFYPEDEYDLAGFAVGVVERDRLIDGSKVKEGDVILALRSTGLQSSGFSLVRKVFVGNKDWPMDKYVPEFKQTLGEELLTPTQVYAKPLMELWNGLDVHGIANISGGGLPENLPRALPEGLRAVVDANSWQVPPVFKVLQEVGGITTDEMYNTFNMGVGMVVYLDAQDVERAQEILRNHQVESFVIGEIIEGKKGIDLNIGR